MPGRRLASFSIGGFFECCESSCWLNRQRVMSLFALLGLIVGGMGGPRASGLPKGGFNYRYNSILDGDERHLVGLTQAKKLVVWDAFTGRVIRTLEGYQEPIYLARLLPDGKSVLGQCIDPQTDWVTWGINEKVPRDRSMRLWDIDSGKVLWRVHGLFDGFSRDGRTVYGVSSVPPRQERPKLIFWDLRTGAPMFTMPDFSPNGFLSNIAEESVDGRWFVYSDQSGATAFDLRSHKQLFHMRSTEPVGAPRIAVAGNGDRFFYDSPPGDEGAIDLYSVSQNKAVAKAAFPNGRRPFAIGWLRKAVGFVAFCNGRWMYYNSKAGLVDRGAAVKPPYEIIVSPDERSFAICCSSGEADSSATLTVDGYDVSTFTKRWERSGWGVKCLANGQLVVEDHGAVSLVDIRSGREVRTIRLDGFSSPND